ncbi:DNA alkylation repair protein [Bdellovibrio svalbardensis]|uniref:DNA alkylation repair protein n=1 Tax=Bdellovibrio svalbardensis TaxID=2972972 RepID=A0ABT6DNI9_9BACT|nr:DNA alkylation repair protein [Bdellovibrio svalbardensis]MDG0817396.1 DNA alkylation repair protein [Bdellovibrio svalbardensis]
MSCSVFFKTGKDQYGEGDVFYGLSVPQSRKLAKKYAYLAFKEIALYLKSDIHEERLIGLFILTEQFKSADDKSKAKIFNFLLKNIKRINNWDLVDQVAPSIFGPYLYDKDRSLLYDLVHSKNLWERRIAIMSTFYFLRQQDFKDTLKIAKLLLHDEHDLIHKAVGWMLREIGNRDVKVEMKFLDQHASKMPRTMLRYAIEKFPAKQREHYLKLKIR